MRRNAVAVFGLSVLSWLVAGIPNLDRDVPYPIRLIDASYDVLVGFYDFVKLNLEKVVERVDVLLYEAFDLQECWKKIPFVFGRVHWVG
jgi:hypothetical protein